MFRVSIELPQWTNLSHRCIVDQLAMDAVVETGEGLVPMDDQLGSDWDPSRPPSGGELSPSEGTLHSADEGLLENAEVSYVNDDVEELTDELRHQIGLFPDEERELSEALRGFGLGPKAFDQQRLEKLATDKETTSEQHLLLLSFDSFAKRNDFEAKYSSEILSRPLLHTNDQLNRKVAPLIFQAIQRFMEHNEEVITILENRPKKSVMSRVCQSMNPKSPKDSSSSSSSSSSFSLISETKNLGLDSHNSGDSSPSTPDSSRSSSVFTETGSDPDDPEAIPRAEMDLVHYIIAHGIVRPSLRDEIVCQLCCQVTDNPSTKSRERGWMLLALCAGCFLPSKRLIDHYFAFLHNAPAQVRDFARYIMVVLRRTNANGMRFHPPSWIELQAVKLRRYPVLQVELADGRVVPVESDPATSAWEMCLSTASAIGVNDHFGFSIYVGAHRKISSLGSGSDHVMDAICECEQLLRVEEGVAEERSPWRIHFRKELFTPWHNPSADPEATELVYHQILSGVSRGEYALLPEEVPKVVARIFYVEHGHGVNFDLISSRIDEYLPKGMLANQKSRDRLVRSILTAFETRGYSVGILTTQQVKNQVVSVATNLWPLNFSAMFEALRHSGPPLASGDVILAVNGEGVFILDGRFRILVGFHYYDIVDCLVSSEDDLRRSTVGFVVLDGNHFRFLTPNASVVHRIVSVYLEGLRRRSRWGVALHAFQLHDYTGGSGDDFRLVQGDIVELVEGGGSRRPLHSSWLLGRCERTRIEGSFPSDVVYVLPTIERPDDRFLRVFRSMEVEHIKALPQNAKDALILSSGTTGRHLANPIDSFA